MRFSNLVPFSLTQLLFLLDFTPATFTEHSCSLGKFPPLCCGCWLNSASPFTQVISKEMKWGSGEEPNLDSHTWI